MDTGKLLKIILDIQEDERKFNFQTRLQNILNYYNDGNSESLNQERAGIEADLGSSLLNNYVMTDLKALEKLSAEAHFGLSLITTLNSALRSESHEVKTKLEQLIQKRQEFLTKFEAIRVSLTDVKLNPRILEDGEFVLGFSLPDKYSDLQNLDDLISDLDNFLMALAGDDDESKKYRIISVENGSIDFYISAAQHLATNFDIAIEYIIKIFDLISMCIVLKSGYAHYKDKQRKKTLDDLHNENLKQEKQALVDEFLNEIQPESPDKSERIKGLLNKMIKHFENGVSAEVITPHIEAPREPNDQDSEDTRKDLEKKMASYSAKKMIDERNKKMLALQQSEFGGMRANLLEDAENKEDTQSNSENIA